MNRSRWIIAPALALLILPSARADEKADAVVAKAIKALGGEEKLAKAGIHEIKSTGKLTINGDENPIKGTMTFAGLDRMRNEFEMKFGDNDIKGVVILNKDKGWRKFNDMNMEVDGDGLDNEKRTVLLHQICTTVVPIKGKGFKVELGAEEKVDDKPADVLNVTSPDGKTMKLFIDKESGLPTRMFAKVAGFGGDEVDQETTFSDFKESGGIKKAMKSESKRNGESFIKSTVVEFKVLEKADDKKFAEPE